MAKKTETNQVTVQANCQLFEAGASYAKGETFVTTPATPERAEALGTLVETTAATAAKPEA
jgi:hypothetical protein